jgi:hypothetical protein
MEATMPGGRPTDYDPAYCEQVIEFLKDGYSVAAFAGHIGKAASTVELWRTKHPEFSEAVKVGQAGAVLWWENRARAVARGEDGNPTAVIFGLKNRAPDQWRDKTEQDVNATHNVRTITHRIVRPEQRGD